MFRVDRSYVETLESIVDLSKKNAVGERASLREALREDLAWYSSKASDLKDPEKMRLAQACVERIRRILET